MKYKYTDYRLGLASNIKHYRLKAGYTQEQLEKIAGRNYWRVLKTAERMSGRYA